MDHVMSNKNDDEANMAPPLWVWLTYVLNVLDKYIFLEQKIFYSGLCKSFAICFRKAARVLPIFIRRIKRKRQRVQRVQKRNRLLLLLWQRLLPLIQQEILLSFRTTRRGRETKTARHLWLLSPLLLGRRSCRELVTVYIILTQTCYLIRL